MMRIIAALGVLAPAMAFAAGAEEAHAEGIPMAVVYQAINFALYVGLLFFLLRKPVKSYFANREAAFKQALVKAQAARQEAEQRRREVEDRLSKLQSSADDSVANARAEAAALKTKITQEAQQLAQSLREEARRSAELEIERARHQLREELLAQALALSAKMLQDKMAEPDQKRLQTESVDKIQVVR